MDKALLVIDMQNDYLWEKRKARFAYDTEKLVSAVNGIIRRYQGEGCDVIYTRHIIQNLPTNRLLFGYSIAGTEGAELYKGLDIVSDLCFEKNRSDTYTAGAFREYMKKQNYSVVALCGLDECGCVGATAKGAVKTKVKVKMLGECIGSRFPENKVQNMRQQLTALGVEYI